MAWEDMLNHKCDIYHIAKKEMNLGYGITDTEHFLYPAEPDLADVPCHFHIKTGNLQLVQTDPLDILQARIKISLPFGTDIRTNDKVVSHETGYAYMAEVPRVIHNNHHIIAYLKREKPVKGAI